MAAPVPVGRVSRTIQLACLEQLISGRYKDTISKTVSARFISKSASSVAVAPGNETWYVGESLLLK
jgi:hypothetical protein